MSILTFRETILAPRKNPGRQFRHLGTALEGKAVPNRICIDFGVILEPLYISFFGFKRLEMSFFLGLVSRSRFLLISEPKFRRWRLKNRGFREEGIAQIDVSLRSFCMIPGVYFCRYVGSFGSCFSGFWCLENKLEIRRIFNEKNESRSPDLAMRICTEFGP